MMGIAALGLKDARGDHSRRRGDMSAGATTPGVSSRQTAKLVGKFDRSLRRTTDVLVGMFGEENAPAMHREMLDEFRRVIPEIPYVGGRRNPYSGILRGVAWGVAMHRVVLRHGGSLHDTGELMHRRNRARLWRIPRVVRHGPVRRLFIRQQERAARRSQARRYPGDWVMEVVDGDGESFDYGLDVTECGALKFLQQQRAEELLPYICDLDYVMAEAMGYELRRTKTLAWGCDRCDFRISMDGETAAPWPPEFVEQTCGQPQAEEEAATS
jgi:hypothetical protein